MTTASFIPLVRGQSNDVAGFDSAFDGVLKHLQTARPQLHTLVGMPEPRLSELAGHKASELELEPMFFEELRRLRVLLDSIEAHQARLNNARAMQRASDRAAMIKNELVKRGELVSADTLGKALSITRQAIHKQAKTGRIFFVEAGREHYFPIFFADADLRDRGLENVLALLSAENSWSKWLFLTKPNGSLGGMTPLEALRNNQLAEVMTAARAYIER